ncbi:MAG: hypothetical protein ABIZ80_02400 [Bryobacteraceae bacterium]
MRLILIRSGVALAAIAIVWIFGGRYLSLLAGRIWTVRLKSVPVLKLGYNGVSLQMRDDEMTGTLPDYSSLDLHIDSSGRVVIMSGGQSLALGPRTAARNPANPADFEFAPDTGDEVTFVVDRGAISWPTPFEMNFMTGYTSSWRRHFFYRLDWKKRSGGGLRMRWRYEQGFYPADGWTSATMIHEGTTGLIEVNVIPETGGY